MRIPDDMQKGSIHKTKNNGSLEVVDYLGAASVFVRFTETGYETKTSSAHIRSGMVKGPYARNIFGVGFIGEGRFKSSNKSGRSSKEYSKWRGMIARCYSERELLRKPCYEGVSVCDEWMNFQNFAEWLSCRMPSDGGSYAIDKDIKIFGNKIYSPETCLIVPSIINGFVIDQESRRGKYKIGVSFHRNTGKFVSQCNNPITKKLENLGYFSLEADAHNAWRKRKSELASLLIKHVDNKEAKRYLGRYKESLDLNLIHNQ